MKTLVSFVLVLLLAVPAHASIDNGGFETGDLTDWYSIGNASVLSSYDFSTTTVTAYDGKYMAMIGSETADTNYNMFNQAMQNTSGGTTLSFAYNFWSYDYAPYDSPGFSVTVNGNTVFTLSAGDIDTDGSEGGFDISGWRLVSLDISDFIGPNFTIGFMAGDSADLILRTGVFIDNVSLSSTPVPAAIWLLGSGLVGLVGLRRRVRA